MEAFSKMFSKKTHKHINELSNTIRIQLKKEDETFFDKTEDLYITYAL